MLHKFRHFFTWNYTPFVCSSDGLVESSCRFGIDLDLLCVDKGIEFLGFCHGFLVQF
ncbi:MAG TPA: hypothetical protein VH601_17035 [Bryobacteraceae bacterium]